MDANAQEPLLVVSNLKIQFAIKGKGLFAPKKTLRAVDDVSFSLARGQTLGVVGESGCGKSTLARTIMGLVPAISGSVRFAGQELIGLDKKGWRQVRQGLGMIFQDPLASLNPRMTIGDIIAEPLVTQGRLGKTQRGQYVREMMARVGLLPNVINRYPHEFSGGQCQRIGIARALITRPQLLICDEPVSALDVSIQAQVVNLLKDLQEEMGLALLFIAHDLSIVKHISDRVMVMYLGRTMEIGTDKAVYQEPEHPYTRALLSAVPHPNPRYERQKTITLLEGDLPSPIDPPKGCVFVTRCPLADEECTKTRPVLKGASCHQVACLKAPTSRGRDQQLP